MGVFDSVTRALGGVPLTDRAGVSQGDLWRQFVGSALTMAPMALGARGGMALPARPNTAGVSMPAGAARLPPAWAASRRGYGWEPQTPMTPANGNVRRPMLLGGGQ
jgi:hypothetical protein